MDEEKLERERSRWLHPHVHPKQIPGATSRVRCGEKEKVCGRGENEVREVVSACSDRLTDRNMVDKF